MKNLKNLSKKKESRNTTNIATTLFLVLTLPVSKSITITKTSSFTLPSTIPARCLSWNPTQPKTVFVNTDCGDIYVVDYSDINNPTHPTNVFIQGAPIISSTNCDQQGIPDRLCYFNTGKFVISDIDTFSFYQPIIGSLDIPRSSTVELSKTSQAVLAPNGIAVHVRRCFQKSGVFFYARDSSLASDTPSLIYIPDTDAPDPTSLRYDGSPTDQIYDGTILSDGTFVGVVKDSSLMEVDIKVFDRSSNPWVYDTSFTFLRVQGFVIDIIPVTNGKFVVAVYADPPTSPSYFNFYLRKGRSAISANGSGKYSYFLLVRINHSTKQLSVLHSTKNMEEHFRFTLLRLAQPLREFEKYFMAFGESQGHSGKGNRYYFYKANHEDDGSGVIDVLGTRTESLGAENEMFYAVYDYTQQVLITGSRAAATLEIQFYEIGISVGNPVCYGDLENKFCSKCNSDLNLNDCTECHSGYHLKGTSCYINCASTNMYNFNQFTCKTCPTNCLTCDRYDFCTTCPTTHEVIELSTGFVRASIPDSNGPDGETFDLGDKVCLEKCPGGQTKLNSLECFDCSGTFENCLSCETNSNCGQCKSTMIFDAGEGKCLCPSGSYFNIPNQECRQILENCVQVDSNGVCQQCDDSQVGIVYELKDNFCKLTCQAGEAWVTPNNCEKCDSGCFTCEEITKECLDKKIFFSFEQILDEKNLDYDKSFDVTLMVSLSLEQGKEAFTPSTEEKFEDFFLLSNLKEESTRETNEVKNPVTELSKDSKALILKFNMSKKSSKFYTVDIQLNGVKGYIDNDISYSYDTTINNKKVEIEILQKDKLIEVNRYGQLSNNLDIASEGINILASTIRTSSSSTLIQFSQNLKIFKRLIYINVDYGDKLDGFLGGLGIKGKDQMNEEEKKKYYEISRKHSGKMSTKYVRLYILNALGYKILLYCFFFFLKIQIFWMISCMKKKKKAPKKLLYFIFIIRKAQFIIFTSVSPDLFFFCSRAINDITELQETPQILHLFLSIGLIIMVSYDLAEVFFNGEKLKCMKSKLHLENSKITVEKYLKNKDQREEELILKKMKKNLEEIDFETTIRNIYYNRAVLDFIQLEFITTKEDYRSALSRHSSLIFLARTSIYQIMLTCFQNMPQTSVLILIVFEFFYGISVIVKFKGKKCIDKFGLIGRLFQGVFLFVFLLVVALNGDDMNEPDHKEMSEKNQNFSLTMIQLTIMMEIFILCLGVVKQIVQFFEMRLKTGKEVKKVGKLQLAEINFFYRFFSEKKNQGKKILHGKEITNEVDKKAKNNNLNGKIRGYLKGIKVKVHPGMFGKIKNKEINLRNSNKIRKKEIDKKEKLRIARKESSFKNRKSKADINQNSRRKIFQFGKMENSFKGKSENLINRKINILHKNNRQEKFSRWNNIMKMRVVEKMKAEDELRLPVQKKRDLGMMEDKLRKD